MVKKTEYICVQCWTAFPPGEQATAELACPSCGVVQDVQDEPVDLAPEEFLKLAHEEERLSSPPDLPPPIPAKSAPSAATHHADARSDDDFDGVVEIDLGEIEDADDGDLEDALRSASGAVSAAREAAPRDDAVEATAERAEGPTLSSDDPPPGVDIWQLKTKSANIYAFISPDSMVRWVSALKQDEQPLEMSLDGELWSDYGTFKNRYAKLRASSSKGEDEALIQQAAALLGESADDPDITADIEATLNAEMNAYSVGDIADDSQASQPKQDPVAKADPAGKVEPPALVTKPVAPPPVVRRTAEFTFKVEDTGESSVKKTLIIIVMLLILGGAGVVALGYFGVIPRLF